MVLSVTLDPSEVSLLLGERGVCSPWGCVLKLLLLCVLCGPSLRRNFDVVTSVSRK